MMAIAAAITTVGFTLGGFGLVGMISGVTGIISAPLALLAGPALVYGGSRLWGAGARLSEKAVELDALRCTYCGPGRLHSRHREKGSGPREREEIGALNARSSLSSADSLPDGGEYPADPGIL